MHQVTEYALAVQRVHSCCCGRDSLQKRECIRGWALGGRPSPLWNFVGVRSPRYDPPDSLSRSATYLT